MPKRFYVTTAIDYVNAAPHLGHAYEKIATDAIARFHRLLGEEVFFLTGTDEHGTKVEKAAKNQLVEPKAYTDTLSQEFKRTWDFLNVWYNRFIRTTDPDHYAVVASLWRKMRAKDDIYKASYIGQYCSGCELFLTERDLNEAGECAIHLRKPETVEEENYFFRLSKYKDAIRRHLEASLNTDNPFVRPLFRAHEVLRTLDEIEDISVSRSRHSVGWGIPVPDDPDQIIYVWIDALSNYLTGVGYEHDEALFQRFWPADIHMIGKDILRFHAIYWPAMLLSAEIPLPGCIYAHGFININDSKISKSLGNVIAPSSLAERFQLPNADPIRYYLLSVTHFGNDGNFTEDDFKRVINADLANNLGNLLNRTLNMTLKYFEGSVPQGQCMALPDIGPDFEALIGRIERAYHQLEFLNAIEGIILMIDAANKLINQAEPWNLHKNGKLQELADVMFTVLETLRQTSILLSPVTPTLCETIWRQLGCKQPFSEVLWTDILGKPLSAGQQITLEGPLLPRLDSEIAGAAKKAQSISVKSPPNPLQGGTLSKG